MSLENELRLLASIPVLLILGALVSRALRAARHRRDVEKTWR